MYRKEYMDYVVFLGRMKQLFKKFTAWKFVKDNCNKLGVSSETRWRRYL